MSADLPGIAAIKGLLEMMASVERAERGRGGFLLEHGRQWLGTPLPPGVRQGVPKACFSNSQRLVMSRPQLRLRYCEGYALSASLAVPIPIHHGWAVDEDGKVFDVTFQEPTGSVYYGVPFTMEYLATRATRGTRDSFLDGNDMGHGLLHDRAAASRAVEQGWGVALHPERRDVAPLRM